MLSGDFFYITGLEQINGKITAVLEINAGHKIFDGHFPGQPVVPGVCMMQMVREVLESALAKSTKLENADNLKFLRVVDPTEIDSIHAEIKYTIEEDGKIKVVASLANESVTYFKMNAIFCMADP